MKSQAQTTTKEPTKKKKEKQIALQTKMLVKLSF